MFNQIVNNLKQIDVRFNDKDKTLMLLNSLPPSSIYGNLVTPLMWGKETLVSEETTGALLSFNLRNKTGDGNSQGKRLAVRSNQKRRRNKSRNKLRNNKTRSKSSKGKDIQCYKCGKT
jgi:hypothetical protein